MHRRLDRGDALVGAGVAVYSELARVIALVLIRFRALGLFEGFGLSGFLGFWHASISLNVNTGYSNDVRARISTCRAPQDILRFVKPDFCAFA